jgi:hypothetical protein
MARTPSGVMNRYSFPRHQQQARAFGMAVGGHHGEVHENPWQVEQAGEPAGDEDDVEGFYPEHDVSAVVIFVVAARIPVATVG